jgi:hypothetical protein
MELSWSKKELKVMELASLKALCLVSVTWFWTYLQLVSTSSPLEVHSQIQEGKRVGHVAIDSREENARPNKRDIDVSESFLYRPHI